MSEPSSARVSGEFVSSPWRVFRSSAVVAAALCVGFAGIAKVTPGAGVLNVLAPQRAPAAKQDVALIDPEQQTEGKTELEQETTERQELAQPEHAKLPTQAQGPIATGPDGYEAPAINTEQPPLPIIDAANSMAHFYAALGKSGAGVVGATTRIAYFGDSLVASDYVTATLRRKLQDQFGDAGHGFVLIANAWPAYFHNDVFRYATRGWSVSRVVGPYAKDGLYGYGGVSFEGNAGVLARFGTATKGDRGRNVSVFRLAYLEQPRGGELEVNVDGQHVRTINTDAADKRSGFADIPVPDGEHLLELITRKRPVRAFGVVLERERPGVVLDAVGIQGARIRFLDKTEDEHWAEQLAWRKPDLLVFQFGANESGDGFAYSMEDYHLTMMEVLRQAKQAVPTASCLVTAALDRARKVETGMITVPIIPHIVKQQEITAKEAGCAFWNTYEAMGGNGSMAKWVRRGLGQADLTHPSGVGAEIIGSWLYLALMQGYEQQRKGAAQAVSAPPATAPKE